MGLIPKVRVTPRRLLVESVGRSKDNPNPSEGERAHRALLAFLREIQASELNFSELEQRLLQWPQFLLSRNDNLTDRVWRTLVFDGRQRLIRTEDGGMGGPFYCAAVEEVLQHSEAAVDDGWVPARQE